MLEHPIGGPLDRRRPTGVPTVCGHGRCPSQIACSTSARPHVDALRRHRLDDSLTVIAAPAGRRLRRRLLDGVVELLGGPADVGGFGLPPCRQIGGTVAGLACRGCRPPLPGRARRAPTVSGHVPRGRRNSSSLAARATSIVAGALREHGEQLVGDAGDLGLPVDDRSPTRPRSGGSARRAAPTGTGRRASVDAASGSGRPTPTSGRRRSAPWPRSRRGCGSAGHRPATSSDGTSPSSARACPGAAGRRRSGSGSSTRTAPDARAPRRRRRRGPRAAGRRRSAPTTRVNDFGAENVASNPATARITRPSAVNRSTSSPTERRPRHRVTARQQQLQRLDVDRRRTDRARRPGGPTTRPAPHPAPPSGTGCSTPPSPPPTTRTASSPAASTRAPPEPARGHLSVRDRVVGTWSVRGGHGGSLGRQRKGWLRVRFSRRRVERGRSLMAVIGAGAASGSSSGIGHVIGPPMNCSSAWRGTRSR